MRITFLGHATHLVEHEDTRIITDPWLTDPIFEGLIERDFAPCPSLAALPPIDAIAISHAHLDHFNAPTLAALAQQQVPVFHPPSKFTGLDRNLRTLGFEQTIPLSDWAEHPVGSIRIVATPSVGTVDECAFLFLGGDRSFFDGADAPNDESVLREIRRRFGRIDMAALGHNSFDQPALLGLDSHKDADHGPSGAIAAARALGARAVLPAASNMRWTGRGGDLLTRRVIRRSRRDLIDQVKNEMPNVAALDLNPGDAWEPDEGILRKVFPLSKRETVRHDYIFPYLAEAGKAENPSDSLDGNSLKPHPGWCNTEDGFRRLLPHSTWSAPEASRYVQSRVTFDVTGEDPGKYTYDFSVPGSPPCDDHGATAGTVSLSDRDWRDLLEKRIPWQVLLVSDRLRVTEFTPGPPPSGLHFVYAMQGVFP